MSYYLYFQQHTIESTMEPTTDCCISDTSSPAFCRRRPAEARAILRDILKREIVVARRALEAVQFGKQLDQEIPYVNRAAHILTVPSGKVRLTVCSSTVSGDDKILEAEVSLPEERSKEKALLAQLSLYLLITRGRLSKVIKKTDVNRHEPGPYLQMAEPFQMKREKLEYLEKNEDLYKTTSLRRLSCSADKEWSARILQIVAPHLEKISIDHVGLVHLQILESMPRLRHVKFQFKGNDFAWNDLGPFDWNDEGRFNLESNDPLDPTRPFWFKDIPEDSTAGLVSITAHLPRQILLPLIVQHRRTLRELTLDVDLPKPRGDANDWWHWREWCWCCYDLPQRLAELLERFSLPALRLVKLFRLSSHSEEDHALCYKQLRAVRKVLGPNVTVLCCRCG